MSEPVVLMFHDVVNKDCEISGFQTIGAKQYELQEDRFEQIVKYAINKSSNVVFTFDDGGESFYKVIAPILEKYDRKGIFFISTKYIGTNGFLKPNQIKELHERGHIIASHSHSHPRDISKLSFEQILEEWVKSKSILEKITRSTIEYASIPGGAISEQVIEAMVDAGYRFLYTSEPTINIVKSKYYEKIGRFAITHSSTDTYIGKMLSDANFRFKLLLRYKILGLGKGLLGSNYNKLKQRILQIKK